MRFMKLTMALIASTLSVSCQDVSQIDIDNENMQSGRSVAVACADAHARAEATGDGVKDGVVETKSA